MGAVAAQPAPGRAEIGAAARIDASVRQHLRRVPIFQHCVILVEEGAKELASAEAADRVAAGGLVVLAADSRPDIGNIPDPASGRYVALVLGLGPQALAAFRRLYPALAAQRPAPDLPWQALRRDAALAATLRHAVQGLGDGAVSDRVACHRCVEVLAALAEAGIAFPPDRGPSVADTVRALVAARPARPWSAADAARALGVSEPTLRRRLAAEGASFRALVADIRLTHGLMLLQTTRASILQVALDCGYESPSRFATRFRDRFGMSPSDLRGTGLSESGQG